MSNAIIFLVRVYQNSLAIFLGGNCRFYPSCSHYCIDAFRTHRFWPALRFSVRRICACHPLGGEGYDPVPEHPNPTELQEDKKKVVS